MIAADALESAAIALIGNHCSYLGTCAASGVVAIDGQASEPGCFSDDPARAIVGAFLHDAG